MIELRAGATRVTLCPQMGGGVLSFSWRDRDVFRSAREPKSPLDLASFAMVPFVGRITAGRFTLGSLQVQLPINAPAVDPTNAIHGHGWLAPWRATAEPARAHLIYERAANAWPWAYMAEQILEVDDTGLTHTLILTNQSQTPMPAGFGLHPYFPRNAQTRFHALLRGEVTTPPDGIDMRDQPRDWWDANAVSTRVVDHAYAFRQGDMTLTWPDRGLRLVVTPDESFPHTVVYAPAGADFVCVEPISHLPDALNSTAPLSITGLKWLAPAARWRASVRFQVADV